MTAVHSGNFGDYPDSLTVTETVIEAGLVHETANAILISIHTDNCDGIEETEDVWLPLSTVSRKCTDHAAGRIKLTVKNWILQKKGII
jgi:hypothetical protein